MGKIKFIKRWDIANKDKAVLEKWMNAQITNETCARLLNFNNRKVGCNIDPDEIENLAFNLGYKRTIIKL